MLKNTIIHCSGLDAGVIRSMFLFLSALEPTVHSSWMELTTKYDFRDTVTGWPTKTAEWLKEAELV